jgi:hypothetical protein
MGGSIEESALGIGGLDDFLASVTTDSTINRRVKSTGSKFAVRLECH